jgi:hypothetical protein
VCVCVCVCVRAEARAYHKLKTEDRNFSRTFWNVMSRDRGRATGCQATGVLRDPSHTPVAAVATVVCSCVVGSEAEETAVQELS